MPEYIEDITRRTHIDLTLEQYNAVRDYVTGVSNAGSAAKRLGMNRQRFVNLVFTMIPQWYKDGRIDFDGQFTDVPPLLRGYGFKKAKEENEQD